MCHWLRVFQVCQVFGCMLVLLVHACGVWPVLTLRVVHAYAATVGAVVCAPNASGSTSKSSSRSNAPPR
jgi:hypothetical protein